MLEGLKKELKKEEGEEKGGTRRIVIQAELSSSKKSGEHPRTKVQVYVWKDGVLVKEKEFFEGEPLLGLSIAGIPDVLRYHLKIGEGEGVIVESIDEKSPLYEAGLRTNDIILKVDDKTIKDYETLLSALEGKEKVRFTLLKAGEKKEIEVFLPRKENK
ncbi:MAG: PDZ domain-containing protein [Planctomycetota bacterium]|nr:PDZ domain-containing protein [Planctomycetota bacterium]